MNLKNAGTHQTIRKQRSNACDNADDREGHAKVLRGIEHELQMIDIARAHHLPVEDQSLVWSKGQECIDVIWLMRRTSILVCSPYVQVRLHLGRSSLTQMSQKHFLRLDSSHE